MIWNTSNGVSFQGFAIPADKQSTKVPIVYDNQEYVLSHGSVVIAAITSCTNTSNPSVMLGAGQYTGATTPVLAVHAVSTQGPLLMYLWFMWSEILLQQ